MRTLPACPRCRRRRGLRAGSEYGLELQVREAESGRLRWHSWALDVLGGGVVQDAIDHGGLVEPRDDREPARDRGRLEVTDLLHPSDVGSWCGRSAARGCR
jgi:hypothetical protein